MKKLAAILSLSALATGAFAQGTVVFFPSANSLSSVTIGGTTSATSGAAGSYYYGLLLAPAATGPFTFSGMYATNLAVAGYFGGPGARAVPGTAWAAGATMSYEVAAWSASLGTTYNPSWVTAAGGLGTFTTAGYFGLSTIATGVSGGLGVPATPAYALFGGATGIQNGINLTAVGAVPEPTSMALAGLGAAALLIFRRRK